jgi:phosphopantetheine--protein transferase-like protein
MIGNDIVDLKQAAKDSNWKRPRFLGKIFTPKEQQTIWSAKNQDQMVWLLWSIKEAAYKVNVQQFGKRFFNPKRLECTLLSNLKGEVIIGGNRYFTESIITEDFIYSIALLDFGKSYKSEWFLDHSQDYSAQSKCLKRRFLKTLNLDEVTIIKNNIGVPRLQHNSDILDVSFSLTHHGAFSGYAIL